MVNPAAFLVGLSLVLSTLQTTVRGDRPPPEALPDGPMVPVPAFMWPGVEESVAGLLGEDSELIGADLTTMDPLNSESTKIRMSNYDPNPECREMHYDFTSSEDLSAFRIESCAQNVQVTNGALAMRLTPDCKAVTLAYRVLYTEGRMTFRVKAPNANGTVTCLIGMGTQIADEYDIEIVGSDLSKVQTMMWSNGNRIPGYEKSQNVDVPNGDASRDFIEYAIEHTRDYIAWFMDGQIIRSIRVDQVPILPIYGNEVKLGLWDGSDFPFWAGTLDHSRNRDVSAYVDSITITPFGDCRVRTDAEYLFDSKRPKVYNGTLVDPKQPIVNSYTGVAGVSHGSASSLSRPIGWSITSVVSLGAIGTVSAILSHLL